MRCKSTGLSIALMLAALSAHAAGDCKLQRYAELPVTMSGTRPLITGTIDGVDALFLADSGAPFSILSLEAVEKYHLRQAPLPPGLRVRGVGGAANATMVTAHNVTFAGLGNGGVIPKVDFIVTGRSYGTEMAGIIGQNLLGHADTEYDLANGFIRLFNAKDCRKGSLAYWAGSMPVAEMTLQRPDAPWSHLIGTAKLNGTKIRVMFDSGASRSGMTLKAAARAGIKPDQEGVRAAGLSGGIGNRVLEDSIARFDLLDLGGEQIKNAQLHIADMDLAEVDMLIGADFFLSHRMYISANQHKIFFTYSGGPVFDMRRPRKKEPAPMLTATAEPAAPDAAASAPTAEAKAEAGPSMDAAGYRRRGMASLGRRDFSGAIADFDQAIAIDPTDAESYYQRAIARLQGRQDRAALLGMRDLDEALKLKPDHVFALMERGVLRLAGSDEAGARSDFNTAANFTPNDATIRLRIAQTYVGTGHFNEAISHLDKWIAANPKDERLPTALTGRCLSRAVLGKELDLGLADCTLAMKKGQRTSQLLDNRGMIYLRLGDYDKAIADYQASLALQPRNPRTLYGLGLAEIKKGMKAEGEKDLRSATAIGPLVAENFRRIGLVP